MRDDSSFAPWNESEVDAVVYCNGTMYCDLKKNVDMEYETRVVECGGMAYPSVPNEIWKAKCIGENKRPDTLIKELAHALYKYASPSNEKERAEIAMLLSDAKGWECYDVSFDIESESCSTY